MEGLLEKPLKMKSAFKSTGKSLKCLEKSLNSTFFSVGLNNVDRDQNQFKIVVPFLFGAAYAAPNKSTPILYLFSSSNFSIISV